MWRLLLANNYASPSPPVHEVNNWAGNTEDREHDHEQSKGVIDLAVFGGGGWGGWL
jgi:hypothetical protein